jgi:hypothetical protein
MSLAIHLELKERSQVGLRFVKNFDVTPYAINKWFGKFEALGQDELRKQKMQDNPELICEEQGCNFIDHDYFLYCVRCKKEQKK